MTDTFSIDMLKDVDTGAIFTRKIISEGGQEVTVTGKYEEHPLRKLKGAAFVSITEAGVVIDDERYSRVFAQGARLMLEGGTELVVDDAVIEQALEDIENSPSPGEGMYVPLMINDTRWPRGMRVSTKFRDLERLFNRTEPGKGPHVKKRVSCHHAQKVRGCSACRKKAWEEKLAEVGKV